MKKLISVDGVEYNKQEIVERIEHIVKHGDLNYIDAAVEVAEQLKCEVELIAKFINAEIKEKMLRDAADQKMIKLEHRPGKLPVD